MLPHRGQWPWSQDCERSVLDSSSMAARSRDGVMAACTSMGRARRADGVVLAQVEKKASSPSRCACMALSRSRDLSSRALDRADAASPKEGVGRCGQGQKFGEKRGALFPVEGEAGSFEQGCALAVLERIGDLKGCGSQHLVAWPGFELTGINLSTRSISSVGRKPRFRHASIFWQAIPERSSASSMGILRW